MNEVVNIELTVQEYNLIFHTIVNNVPWVKANPLVLKLDAQVASHSNKGKDEQPGNKGQDE